PCACSSPKPHVERARVTQAGSHLLGGTLAGDDRLQLRLALHQLAQVGGVELPAADCVALGALADDRANCGLHRYKVLLGLALAVEGSRLTGVVQTRQHLR
ncbi:MAG: hypothetical protein ACK559_19520, partial [bacterium]